MQIAGGSGLTPMLQIAQEVVRNPEDKTEVTLVFANKSEDDILLKKELDDMARKHKHFHVSTCTSYRHAKVSCCAAHSAG